MAPIIQTEDYLVRLKNLIEAADVLERHGFITQPLTDDDLLLKRRCIGCNKAMSQLVRKERKPPQRLPPLSAADEMLAAIAQSHLSLEEISTSPAMPDKTFTVLSKQEPTLRCRFHLGTVVNKCWTCCDRNVLAEPCSGSWEHVPRIHDLDELSQLYQFYPTPSKPPKHSDIRPAVAIDCEMGTALSGDSELIRVSMIDYFSGATLVDNIVEPDVPMRHLNTRFSGVLWADVNRARRQKTCLQGKAGARWAIWRYVGPTTLVIGHSVSNDLRALNWLHADVVDSFVSEFLRVKRREAEEVNRVVSDPGGLNGSNKTVNNPAQNQASTEGVQGTNMLVGELEDTGQTTVRVRKPGKFALKTLAKQYLEREIQANGNKGHDSLEDAMAARDLIHWTVLNPEE